VVPGVSVKPATTFKKTDAHEKRIFQSQADAPSCSSCGSIMIRAGACYKCENCGNTSGCG
jgi:ribonucleoside-diphosphate reductase alpha chain